APSTGVVPRSLVIEQVSRGVMFGAGGGYRDTTPAKIEAFLRPSAMRHRSTDESGGMSIAVQPGTPASWATGEHVRMMEQPVEEPGDRGRIAEELAPVLDGTIRGDQGGRLFVSSHHELEQILGRGLWELAHPEVVDDQERDGGDHREVLLARA